MDNLCCKGLSCFVKERSRGSKRLCMCCIVFAKKPCCKRRNYLNCLVIQRRCCIRENQQLRKLQWVSTGNLLRVHFSMTHPTRILSNAVCWASLSSVKLRDVRKAAALWLECPGAGAVNTRTRILVNILCSPCEREGVQGC